VRQFIASGEFYGNQLLDRTLIWLAKLVENKKFFLNETMLTVFAGLQRFLLYLLERCTFVDEARLQSAFSVFSTLLAKAPSLKEQLIAIQLGVFTALHATLLLLTKRRW